MDKARNQKDGFTLIELLVVIAIIALLLAIIVPSLHLVKMKASSAVCLTNTKNLALAWFMYKEDNDGKLMGARIGGPAPWIENPYNQTPGDLSATQTTPPVTDEDEIRGIELGLLYPYIMAPEAYHCPGDTLRKSKYDGTRVFVSYAISSCLNGFFPGESHSKSQVTRYNEITSPSMRYVFVEMAQERNWNGACQFLMGGFAWSGKGAWGWWSPLAINHGDSSVLGFCDGHSELRKWRDAYTRARVTKLSHLDVPKYDVEYPPADQTEDIEYMARGWPNQVNH